MAELITRNPYSLEKLNSYPYENYEQVLLKINIGKDSFAKWGKIPVKSRVSEIKKALTYFENNKDQIAREITEQMGKPLSQSFNEIAGFLERAEHLCNIAEETLSPDILPNKTNFSRRIEHVPLGLIFVIAAWNYPLLIAVNGVLTALLAGNTVLLKHAGLTPSIGEHYEKAFSKMADCENLIQNCIITHDVTNNLIEKAKVDHVIFTGSVEGGKSIKRSAASSFINCNLELGGKDGAYVAKDANVNEAAQGMVDGAMYNAGQSCCGIERVYVHEAVYDEFLEKCCAIVDEYKLGDPLDSETTMGPLAKSKASLVMTEQINEAVAGGAKVEKGGQVLKIGKGTFFEPTIITGIKNSMRVMQEENFGPILPIIKVSSMDEAIRLINDSAFGLTSAIYTSSEESANRFSKLVDTGTVFMNRCDYLDPALPWTGVKDSGNGSALSNYGFYELTRRKAIHFRTAF